MGLVSRYVSRLPLFSSSVSMRAGIITCCLGASALLGGVLPGLAQTAANVLTQHNDNSRTGANLNEILLTTANVNVNQFGKLRTIPVDGQIYAQPLYEAAVTVQGKPHNVVFVATEHNSVYALDAASGTQLWKMNLGASAPTPNNYWGNRYGAYHDMSPEIGITSTPVIDPSTNTLYVVAFVQDNTSNPPTWHYYLHALDVTTGQDKKTFNSPVEIKARVVGTGDGSSGGTLDFDPPQHNQRPALTLQNGLLYIMFASHADTDPYHGWVMAYNAATLAQAGVWCDSPDGGEGGIWQAGQGATVDAKGNVYLMTGNGSSDVQFGGTGYGECFIRLGKPTGGSLPVKDWFLPSNYNDLNAYDADLGSAGLLGIPGTSYLLGGGKQGMLYLVDTSGKVTPNIGHFNPGGDQIVQEFQAIFGAGSSHIHGAPIYYNSPVKGPTVYVWGENDFLRAYQFNAAAGLFNTTAIATSTMTAPVVNAYGAMPGGFLSLSANGSKPGTAIIWATTPYNADANPATVAGIFHAFDAATLKELWNDKMNDARDDVGNFAKFAPPTVANGKVYVPTFGPLGSPNGSGALVIYGLLPTLKYPAPRPMPVGPATGSINFIGVGLNGISAPVPSSRTPRGCDVSIDIDGNHDAPHSAATPVERSLGAYTVVDLGGVPNLASDAALGLSDGGQVTGWRLKRNGNVCAFLWDQGHMTDLGPIVGYLNSTGRGVNSRGEVVGWINTSSNPVDSQSTTHAFLYHQGRCEDLGTLGGKNSQAFAVNDQGGVVGVSNISPTVRHAFWYDHGKMRDLGTLPGGSFSTGYDINRDGHAAGVSTTAQQTFHAALWRAGNAEDLGTLPGGKNSYGRAVNNKDHVVGYGDADDEMHAFFYDGAKMRDLGTLGRDPAIAEGINDADQIVGTSNVGYNRRHGFLWQDGHMIDLNTLLAVGTKWQILEACRINNRGQIVAIGTRPTGERHSLLLTPTANIRTDDVPPADSRA